MSAPVPRPRLELVADDDGPQLESEAIARQWNPEHQLIGALMGLPIERARTICELVPAAAILDYEARWTYEIICKLVADDQPPGPVLVLAVAQHTPSSQALDPAEPPSPGRYHRLTLYLAEVYTNSVMPGSCAAGYAREVLRTAYRAAFETHGVRMQQLAGGGADCDDLTGYFSTMRTELAALWQRCRTADTAGWAQ